jgi:hypothetical protein
MFALSAQRLRVLPAVAALLLASVACSAHAQNAALGSIAGEVRDSSGAIVPGATVVVTNTGTGATRTLTTDSAGHYEDLFLQPGTYEVVLSANGFGKVDRKAVAVDVGAPTAIDAMLPTGDVTTSVTVSSEAPLLDTEKVEQSQVVDQAIVSNVPVASRRFESFVLLTPNVVPDGNTGLIGYRGISGVYNTNIVDGANNNQAFFGEARGRSIGSPYVFPVDDISEFESSAAGYSAELGGAAGGIINAITKSGTNNWHGDLFEYYRSPGWNALDAYAKFQGRSTNNAFYFQQPIKTQNQFGVSVGGPIIKDKLFFHFTYDGFRKVNPIVYTSSFNSASNQVGNLIHLCDGGTVHVTDGAAIYPTTIPNISAAQCTQSVAAVQSQLGGFQRNLTQNIYFPRLDYQLGSKTHISAEFLFENFHQPNGYNGASTVNNGGISNNGTADFHERFLIANAETALSTHSANVVHFQWARDLETDSTNEGGPYSSLSNLVAIGETNALPRGKFPDEHRWQVTDIYSHTFGHHVVKGGFDVNFIHEQIANLYGGNGAFSYSNSNAEYNFTNLVQDAFGVNPTYTYVAANAAPTAGVTRHYASFAQTVDQITGVGADDFWNQNIDGFVEDAWKVTPKLLLQLGLRYDVQLVPNPDMPNFSNPAAYAATSDINPNEKMVQPRVGFNYHVQPGTVIRGGYGIFYGLISNSVYYTERRENGVYQKQYSDSAPVANTPYVGSGLAVGPTYTGQVGAPTCTPTGGATLCYNNNGQYHSYAATGGIPIYTPPGPAPTNDITGAPVTIPGSINPALAAGITIRGTNPYYSNPYSHSWDLTVEQQLPLHSTLTLGYVGNRGMRLPVYIDTNVDPASETFNHTYRYTNPQNGQTTNYTEPIFTNKLYASTGTVATGFSVVNSNYHSFVTTIKKPMAHGVELLANYTWAKAMDGGQTYGGNGTFNGTDAPLIPFAQGHRQGLGAEYARSDLDIRSRMIITVLGKSDFKLGNRFLEYGVNGWQLSGTYTAQSGEPITAYTSGSYTAISGGALGTSGIAINTDAGPTNAAFTSGPGARVPDFIARRNAFAGPGVHNLDARLSRTFPILHDRYSFEVAAEAFNVVNHRNILGVGTSLVAYAAPGATYTPAGSATQTCPSTTNNPGTVGCLVPLSSSTTPFMAETSTSSTIYNERQLQLLARFTF